ncbi:MAG: hypothetical protein MZV64_69025 [Ignavibacteriales bacterium]|nr:hypothetical protein [Ignavibacteriales bacterium]
MHTITEKDDLVEWAEWNYKDPQEHKLILHRETTGTLVENALKNKVGTEEAELKFQIKKLKVGPTGR